MAYWTSLSTKQLGRYAEYVSRLFFAKSGMDVYLPEIDDKGIDFVVRSSEGHFFEIQCKARRQLNYFYIEKTKFPLSTARYLCLLLFLEEEKDDPQFYLIPSRTWESPNDLFVDRLYVKKKSPPEWGLQFSGKNMPLLEPFRVHTTVQEGANQTLKPTALGRRGSP
jgi:hypothetical protein